MAVIANVKRSIDGRDAIGGHDCRIGSPVVEVPLKKNAVRRLARSRRWQLVACLEGSLWITQIYDPRDYVLTAGEVFIVTQPGDVVVEALEDARFYISEMLHAEPFKGKIPHFA
jgi:hypothetical protein